MRFESYAQQWEDLLDRFGKLKEFVQTYEIVRMTLESADCTF